MLAPAVDELAPGTAKHPDQLHPAALVPGSAVARALHQVWSGDRLVEVVVRDEAERTYAAATIAAHLAVRSQVPTQVRAPTSQWLDDVWSAFKGQVGIFGATSRLDFDTMEPVRRDAWSTPRPHARRKLVVYVGTSALDDHIALTTLYERVIVVVDRTMFWAPRHDPLLALPDMPLDVAVAGGM